MIDKHIQKIVVVDQGFMTDLKSTSITDFNTFSNTSIDTKVISLPVTDKNELASLFEVLNPSDLQPGNVLVRPQYFDQFVPIDAFSEELVPRRFGVFAQLCIALGAKEVKVSNVDQVDIEQSKQSTSSANATASIPTGGVEGNFNKDISEKFDEISRSIMALHTLAQGGEANLTEADRILDMYGLRREALFMDIYNMRRVTTNKLNSHQVSFDFTKDMNRIFDDSLKIKLQVMSKLYEGKAEFQKTQKSIEKNKHATKLTVLVEF
jgi:hypothetical protein